MTSLRDKANELNTCPACSLSARAQSSSRTPVPTEQCSTQITRWPYYVAVITRDIPALHKPQLSCSATLRDYLNKNVSHGDSSPWLTPCWGQKKRSGDAVNLWKDVRKAQLKAEKWMAAKTNCLVQNLPWLPAYKLCLWAIHLGLLPLQSLKWDSQDGNWPCTQFVGGHPVWKQKNLSYSIFPDILLAIEAICFIFLVIRF